MDDQTLKNIREYEINKYAFEYDRLSQDEFYVRIIDTHSQEIIKQVDETSRIPFNDAIMNATKLARQLNEEYIHYCWEMEYWLQIGLLF